MASFGVQNHRHSNDGPTQVSATSTTTVPIDTCTSSKEPETHDKEGYHSTIECAYSTGNEHYKNMEYDDAIQSYSKGIALASQVGYFDNNKENKDIQNEEGVVRPDLDHTSIAIRLCLNRAQCYLKTREYMSIEKDCSKAMAASLLVLESIEGGDKLDKERDALLCTYTNFLIKALYRRALGYEYRGDYSKGLQDCNDILIHITLDISPATVQQCSLLRSRLVRLQSKDDQSKKTEVVPSSFVTAAQTLRLNFIEGVPQKIWLDGKDEVRLCIGNEFGLWNRNNMRKGERDDGGDGDDDVFIDVKVLAINTLDKDGTTDSGDNIAKGDMGDIVLASPTSRALLPSGKCDFPVTFTTQKHQKGIPNTTNSHSNDEHGEVDDICEKEMERHIMLRFSLSGALPNGKYAIPIYSLPIRIMRGEHPALHDTPTLIENDIHTSPNDDYGWIGQSRAIGASCIRDVTIATQNSTPNPSSNDGIHCYALECPGTLGIGGKLWDSTFVLLDMLYHHTDSLNNPYSTYIVGKNIIELGSGTGLGGIGLVGLQPNSVTLSDFPQVVPLLKANILLNGMLLQDNNKGVLEQRYTAMPLVWGESIPSEGRSDGNWSELDTIIACDCVYDPIGYAPLIHTLYALLVTSINRDSVVLLVHRHRHPEDSKFFAMLEGVALPALGGEGGEAKDNENHTKEQKERGRLFAVMEIETGMKGGAVLGDVRFFEIRLNRE